MAALSSPGTPDVTGFGVAMGNGVVHVQLTGRGNLAVGGAMSLKTARELARTILQVAGEEAGDGT